MTNEVLPVYRLVLDFPIINRNGHLSIKPITYGGRNRIRSFNEESLRKAHDEVVSAFTPEELTEMGIPMLKHLVLEKYRSRHPERVQQLKKHLTTLKKANPDKKQSINKDNTITKNNITLIDPTSEGGSTAFLVGGSMSGKTTLIVQSLINILKDKLLRDRYNIIIIFSE